MTITATENSDFMRLVDAIKPWLDRIVIVGGWAHRLYRLHPLAQRLDFEPLTTLDTDVAIPERLPVVGQDLQKRLEERGFKEELLGEHRPPVTQYRLRDGNSSGFYAEFLSPLIGGVENRGKPTATVSVAGVTSQKLRYLELLLHAPWRVRLDRSCGFPVEEAIEIQVPNASSYLAQKLLIHEKRDLKERAKNVVYIHDTIQTFGQALPRLQDEWVRNVRPELHSRAATKVLRSVDLLFRELTDTVREASIEARSTGREIGPEELRSVCYAGLRQVFV